MRAAVFHGREDLRLEDVPEPQPAAGEVKLRVLYNGICGSDLHEYYHGPITTRTTPHPLTGIKNPVIMGHELSGEVVALGSGVEDLEIGDTIMLATFSGDGGDMRPVWSTYVVVDYFKSEMSEYDSQFVYLPLEELQRLRRMGGRVTTMQIKLKDNVPKD